MAGFRSISHQAQVAARQDHRTNKTTKCPYPTGSQAAGEWLGAYNKETAVQKGEVKPNHGGHPNRRDERRRRKYDHRV